MQDRDNGRYKDQDDHGGSKSQKGDKRGGPVVGDKGSRQIKSNQDRDKGPQHKDRPKDVKKSEEGMRLPKYKEAVAPVI